MTKIAIITGGSRGIGKACIKKFLKEGWDVINISRTPSQLPEVKEITADLSTRYWETECAPILNQAIKEAGKICLIQNAGMLVNDTVSNIDMGKFNTLLTLNLYAPIILNKIVLPHMKAGSSIIYMGSTLSKQAVAGAASYVISKHALAGLMRATCQDLDNTGIHTACICPGFTNTEMLQSRVNYDKKALADLGKFMAARRIAEPEEIANFVYFAAENPVVNGAMLDAHLGQLQH